MITATAWVPRGFAAQFPDRAEFNDAEFERIAQLARLKLDDAEADLEDAKAAEAEGQAPDGDDLDEVDVPVREINVLGGSTKSKRKNKKNKIQDKEEYEAILSILF